MILSFIIYDRTLFNIIIVVILKAYNVHKQFLVIYEIREPVSSSLVL